MQLICVRHGRTAWNADNRFQGHTDVPLDDEGRAQASALAAILRNERIDAAVSSDLSRAAETARIVLGPRDVALRLDADWREMQLGDWEGLTWKQILAANPQLDATNETAVKAYTPGGGETFDALCERVARAVERITGEVADDGVALVATHAGPLHALLRVLLGDTELKVRFLTASVTRFRRTNGVWTLTRLNQTAHAV
ncbi:MAG TPA: histidine phosphatase family protein [Candidatus Elarobacter sp.]|nr:histidine phosphatase family protein [Candidatus Elarobacter sp.]HEV2738821.1 histidine phosphatase family protein [Candidatus Elarobacter sp.]